MEQDLANTAAYGPADAACTLTRRQHFSAWNGVMAAIVNVWRHVKNGTPSIDAYL